MLHVLRHYFPLRKALLVASETLLLWLVVATGMTAHLWAPAQGVYRLLAFESMGIDTARVRCIFSALLVSVLAQLAIAFNELYDFRVSGSRYDQAQRFVGSMGTAMLMVLGAVVLMNVWGFQRVLDFPGLSLLQRVRILVFCLLVGFALLYLWRMLFHHVLRRASFNERALVLGSGKAAHVLAQEIRVHRGSGFEVVGILPEAANGHAPPAKSAADVVAGSAGGPAVASAARAAVQPFDPEATGTADLVLTGLVLTETGVGRPRPGGKVEEAGTLLELAREHQADVLVVSLADRRRALPTEDLLRCRLSGVAVRDYEGLFEQVTGKIAVEAIRPSYLIFNDGFTRHPLAELAKRLLDLSASLVGIVLAAPFMIGTAVAVRMSSPGPALFTQERVGRDGRKFTLFKFRSMYEDAESRTGPVWATQDDPRITPVGRFIRKTRLDELPQLFNVLMGDMSLVGPRPERQHFVDQLAQEIPYFRQRHIVKPGVTGWAQINYPYGNTVEDALQKLQYDLFYIKYQSLLFDLSILFNTVKTVVLRKGT